MPRLKQLKWVPMLIKAYYDAQNRLETGPKTASEVTGYHDSTDDSTSSRESSPAISPQRPSKRRVQQHKPIPKRRTPSSKDKNARLLQELRLANRRLASLESIQKQLSQMEATIDGFHHQISQIKQEKQNLESEQPPANETPATVQTPANPPMPPYPF